MLVALINAFIIHFVVIDLFDNAQSFLGLTPNQDRVQKLHTVPEATTIASDITQSCAAIAFVFSIAAANDVYFGHMEAANWMFMDSFS